MAKYRKFIGFTRTALAAFNCTRKDTKLENEEDAAGLLRLHYFVFLQSLNIYSTSTTWEEYDMYTSLAIRVLGKRCDRSLGIIDMFIKHDAMWQHGEGAT